MNNIIDLNAYRLQAMGKKAFAAWEKRFQLAFDRNACPEDLPNVVLYLLAKPGEENMVALNELILGALDLGSAASFDDLPAAERLRVMDIQLRLADRLRFEIMHRLGWIGLPPEMERTRLLEIVSANPKSKALAETTGPVLKESHPRFDEYRKQIRREQAVFIRRLFADALKAFEKENGY